MVDGKLHKNELAVRFNVSGPLKQPDRLDSDHTTDVPETVTWMFTVPSALAEVSKVNVAVMQMFIVPVHRHGTAMLAFRTNVPLPNVLQTGQVPLVVPEMTTCH